VYYIIQKNLFREDGHDKLIDALTRFDIPFELVDVLPFVEKVEFNTDRKDVFVFGSLKLARLAKNYELEPGAIVNEYFNYEVYSKYYKDHLLNYDSKIVKFDDDFEWKYPQYFIRPTLDSKTFTGKVFDKSEWKSFKEMKFTDGHVTSLTKDTLIQIAKPKKIYNEIRCWVIDGKVVTQSLYKQGLRVVFNNIVDNHAIEFCQNMLNIFQMAKAFVMDVCLTENGWKIVECGSISCAGFYAADVQKILINLENTF